MTTRRSFVLVAAVVANVAIALVKFIAAAISGSAGLFSEGLHSVVDTGDGLLVLLGLRLSRRPASKKHPYGHGAQVYFWSMVVAMSIFGVGGGVSIYEGIQHARNGRMPEHAGWSYLVLAIAFVFEGISWLISVRSFRHVRGDRGVWEEIERAKDPTTFVVVIEDSAALIGISVAAAGIAAARAFDMPIFDALASIIIGLLLFAAGGVLGRETWSLLLGESASGELVDSVYAIARGVPGVTTACRPRTLHLGPDVVHVDLDITVDTSATARELVELTRRIERAVAAKHPEVHRVSVRFPEHAEDAGIPTPEA